jgi:hypothetical protein
MDGIQRRLIGSSRLFSVRLTKDLSISVPYVILHHHDDINYFPSILRKNLIFICEQIDTGEHFKFDRKLM